MNRLSTESSPYLRQHAGDPVDWFPWCDEAFDEALRRDVPVMLSVGYAACHWCHVMAAQTFADTEVADALRSDFVAIKVDREELPEIDGIYMDALIALTGRGGWPMTMMLDAQRRPFWGGMYYDRDAFLGLLSAVRTVWTQRRGEVDANAESIVAALAAATVTPLKELPGPELINNALTQLARGFDRTNGGFGSTPKFANPMGLDLVMRAHMIQPSQGTVDVITTSLDAMISGGLFDHLEGGFARYSTDERWLVPHFEKMLYDQAMMIGVYRRGWSLFGRPAWRYVVEITIDGLLSTFRHPAGGLCSSLDADSKLPDGTSVEGAYYTWTPHEMQHALDDDAAAAIEWFGITDSGHLDGRSIPNRLHARGDIIPPPAIDHARRRLISARRARPHPNIDDKVVTEWNALAVSALADAGMVMDRPDWIDAAQEIATFLVDNLRDDRGTWLRVWHADGHPRARHRAGASDLAALVDACTRLGEATGRARWTELAVETANDLLDHHWDADDGGVVCTAIGAPQPLVTRKDLRDDTTPSANTMAAGALLRLSAIVDEPRYLNHTDRILQLIGTVAMKNPTSATGGLAVLESRHRGITEVVIPGEAGDLVRTAMSIWRPDIVLAWGERTSSSIWHDRIDGSAYICRQQVCESPVSDAAELRARLTGRPVTGSQTDA